MKKWKKVVLWAVGLVAVVLVAVAAYMAGFHKGKIEELRTQVYFHLALDAAHYSLLQNLETEELAQNRDWRHVMGNLMTCLYSTVCFVDQYPGYFEFEGASKESFEQYLQKAREITQGKRFLSLREITEMAMGTTNLTETVGRDSISYTRNKEPEED